MRHVVGRHVRRWMIGIALALIVVGVVPVASTFAQTPAPPCTGSGCDSRDPKLLAGSYSCASPPSGQSVIDVETATAPVADGGIITIVLKYSTWCQGYWARGVYTKPAATTIWSFDVQITTANPNWGTVYHALIGQALGTDGYTNMYTPTNNTRPDACLSFLNNPQYRVCTRRVKLEFVQGGALGRVGTDCNNPTLNPPPNIWKFRVVGLGPPGVGRNTVARLTDGVGGIWQNRLVYQCVSPFRWPLIDEPIMFNGTYGGQYVYVAAWPSSNQLVSGRTYRAEINTTNGTVVTAAFTAP
jgi:hypothetical protein